MNFEIVMEKFVLIKPYSDYSIRFTIDEAAKLKIRIGCLYDINNLFITSEYGHFLSYELAESLSIEVTNETIPPGEYSLNFTTDDRIESHCKIRIEILSKIHLQVETVSPTLGTNKKGSVKVIIYYENIGNLITDAEVRVGSTILPYHNGFYSDILPVNGYDFSAKLDITAVGYYNGIKFHREIVRFAAIRTGEFVFEPPYAWCELNETIKGIEQPIFLRFEAQIKKPALYGVTATLTDGNGKNSILEGTDFFLEPGKHTLFLPFDKQEILKYGKGPFYVKKLLSYFVENDDNECDTVEELETIPPLYL